MSIEQRTRGRLPGPGPYVARITNLLDPTYMGSMEVVIEKGFIGDLNLQSQTYIVKYLMPFYGVTNVRYEGTDQRDFNSVQKSYGMWMVPPDIGTTVLVIFVDGDPNQGFWMGCVADQFQDHMIPGIAASQDVYMTPEQELKYGTKNLPVAEFHKRSIKDGSPNPNSQRKPIHPFADRLLAQGLLLDTIRGVTSSSARREVPSTVFGISTPGPIDKSNGSQQGIIGYETKVNVPISRLGGTQFVMDDGDANGQNELVRIRTRTGHQILLHNSSDLVYIANSKGTAWIEMTSDGKLDIYAKDSVSIHTENDFNFRADRDINIEAGRNLNIRAMQDMETNVTGHYFLIVDDYAKISVRNDKDETIGQSSRLTIGQDMHIEVVKDAFVTASGEMDLAAETSMKQSTGGSFHVGAAGNYYETAAQIHMNGPAAAAAIAASSAVTPPYLSLFTNPNRSTESGWSNGNFYKTDSITSIMQRVPTHEPWDQHENTNPTKYSSSATDVTLQTTPGSPRANSGIAPTTNTAPAANTPDVVPGVCDVKYATMIGNSSAQAGIAALKAAATAAGLTTPYAVASLLAVAGGESKWTIVTESFNYKSADRLLQVFPSVFKGDAALAQQYVGNPNNSLPEFLYGYQSAKGKGLGNTQEGDGAKFIGRGFIQLTGRGNYTKYGSMAGVDIVNNPELINNIEIAAKVSAAYFKDRVKLAQTDAGYIEAAIKAVGACTPDIYATKKGLYNCFLGQLQGGK